MKAVVDRRSSGAPKRLGSRACPPRAGLGATVLVFVAVLFALPSTASAGPWTPEQGHGYAKIWAKYLLGFGYVDGEGDINNYANYHELFLSTYGDVGLVNGLAMFWHMDLVRGFFVDDPRSGDLQSEVAPGDPSLGFRWRFFQGDRVAMSLTVATRAPLASGGDRGPIFERGAGDDGVFDEVARVRVGTGVWAVPLRYDIGYAFDTWYISASLGYTYLSGDYDDRVGFSAEIGAPLGDKFTGRIRLSGVFSLPQGGVRSESPSGMANGTTYTGVALELDYEFRENFFLGMTLEGGAGLLRRQTGGPVLSLAVSTLY